MSSFKVLILIVMEERIEYYKVTYGVIKYKQSLNPYCNGRKNRIICADCSAGSLLLLGLNPYCNGRKNRIINKMED